MQQRINQGTLKTTRILAVGCGLGLLVEGLKDEGFSRAWGINLNDYFASLWDQATCPVSDGTMTYEDPTTHATSPIQAGQQWPCEVRGDIRPLLGKFDIRTMTTANIQTLTGLTGAQRSFDLIITEDVMTNYTPAEVETIYAACDARLGGGGQVRHLVSVGWNSADYGLSGGAPWSLAEWTASLGGRTNHAFQDIAGVSESVA